MPRPGPVRPRPAPAGRERHAHAQPECLSARRGASPLARARHAGRAARGPGLHARRRWVNGTSRTRSASALVVLRRARPKKVTRIALPFADRSAEAGLLVAPEEVASMNATTTTVPITLTTGLAAAAGMVVEGMPIASDGRFALVGITAES